MSETKFAKGEWYISHWESANRYDLQVSTSDETEANPCGYICTLILTDDDDDINIFAEQELNRANAHLVAAAPEMYHEIEKDIDWLSRMILTHGADHPMTPMFSDMKQDKITLLAKARGES